MRKHPIAGYVGVVYVLAFIVQFVIIGVGSPDQPSTKALGAATMLIPGLTALLFLRRAGRSWRELPLGPGKPGYLLLGAVVPAATAILTIVLITFLGLGYSGRLGFGHGMVQVAKGGFLTHGEQSWPAFLANLVATAAVFGVINGLVAAGEEIGWRGYLQPKLTSRWGLFPGIAVTGLIWAYWHTPLNLAGYLNYPNNRVFGGLVLWPIDCVLISVVLGWLTINSKSVWPAAIAHGSLNAFHGHLVDDLTINPAHRTLAELVTIGVLAIAAAIAFLLTKKPDAPAPESGDRKSRLEAIEAAAR